MNKKILIVFLILFFINTIVFGNDEKIGNKDQITQESLILLTSVEKTVSKTIIGSFIEYTIQGGAILYPIYFLIIAGIFIIINRVINLQYGIKPTEEKISELYDSDAGIAGIMESLKSNSGMGKIILKIFRLSKEDYNRMELSNTLRVEAGISVLLIKEEFAVIIIIAILTIILGFLGAISNIMIFFNKLELLDQVSARIIYKGFVEAFIPLQLSLIAGLIFTAAYFFLIRGVENFFIHILKTGDNFINIITADKLKDRGLN